MTQTKTRKVLRKNVRSLIETEGMNGHFESVSFIKRKDGSDRKFTFRQGVKKYVKGTGLKFSPASKGLIKAWIPENQRLEIKEKDSGYRFIPVEGVKEFVIAGTLYTVVEQPGLDINGNKLTQEQIYSL
jgi:hypothetical protein